MIKNADKKLHINELHVQEIKIPENSVTSTPLS
jgi:hypothetical protein